MDVSKQIQCNIIVALHLNFFLNLQFWHVLIFSLLVTRTLCTYFEMWHRTEVACSGTLVLTRSPYLFMAIVNGLMPMKNLWLLSSMIRLFPSQMILLCMSSCAGREQTTHHRDTHVMNDESVEVQAWNPAHLFIIGYAMYALPDLPLCRDRFVRVWDHLLWAAKQYEQQSCSQQEAKTLPRCKDDSGGTPLICTYLKTQLYHI